MKKRTIAIFTGYYLPHLGGVERYTDKLSSALTKLGYDIVIVTSNHGGVESYEKNDKRSIYRLPILNVAKERYPIPNVNAEYKQLIKQIEAEDIDYFIVNTRFHLTSLTGARMGARQKRPVLLIEHGTDHFTVGNKVLDFFGGIYEHGLTEVIKRHVSKFYGVSKNCSLWLRHFSITASGVFYNAIQADDRLSVKDYYDHAYPDDEVVVTYAGRLIKEKGVLNLLAAFKQLNTDKKVRLVVAGSGELLESIKQEYTEENIDIVGKLDFEHIMALYKRTDIFVHPSLYPEGLPTSILEAGLMECAIIATPRGGTEEVIIDDEHGIIVDGSVDSLRIAIESLVDDVDARKRRAEKVMTRIKAYFDWDSVAKEVDKEIKGLSVK